MIFARRSRSASACRAIADRKSTRLNSSHSQISYAVFCLKKKKTQHATCERKQAAQPRSEAHEWLENNGPVQRRRICCVLAHFTCCSRYYHVLQTRTWTHG